MSLRRRFDELSVWTNRQPWLSIRIVLWVLTAGWAFFVYYLMAAATLVLSIVFTPFAFQVLRLAVFTLNPISLEPKRVKHEPPVSADIPAWRRANHPYTLAANVFWCLTLGWPAAVGHVLLGAVQALTIIGIPTALTSLHIAWFVLWPFPFEALPADLPTTLVELDAQRHSEQFRTQPTMEMNEFQRYWRESDATNTSPA